MKQPDTLARKCAQYASLSVIIFLGCLVGLSRATATKAATALAFTPPSSVQVQMIRLSQSGGVQPGRPTCTPGDPAYGCTANPSWPYPYTTNPASVAIETDYLLNVVTRETYYVYYHSSALEAIAAAARSYVFYKIRAGAVINNSNESQVFVPYEFEKVNGFVVPNGQTRCTTLQHEGQTSVTGSSQASLCNLAVGADSEQSAVLAIQLPNNWPQGTTTMLLDINAPATDANLGCSFAAAAASPQTYDLWFSKCNWPAYRVTLCLGACQAQLPLIRKDSNTGWPGQ